MCEVNVTCLVSDVDPFVFSHSAAEAGEANKWSDALDASKDVSLPGLDVDDVNQWRRDMGGSDADKVMGEAECVALVLQYAAGDLRELQSLAPGDGLGGIDWTEAEALAEAGTCGGNLFAGDDGNLHIYIGN